MTIRRQEIPLEIATGFMTLAEARVAEGLPADAEAKHTDTDTATRIEEIIIDALS